MLVTLKQLLPAARDGNHAVAGFNVFGLDDAQAVVKTAERLRAPVIVMVNRPMVDHYGVDVLGPCLRAIGRSVGTPVCTHLDHAKDPGTVFQAIMAGFSSVMFDGSHLPLEENIRQTNRICAVAHACGVSVEAEVGAVPYSDSPEPQQHVYTSPAEAARFAAECPVDALAVSVGNVHRLTEQQATVDLDLVDELEQVVPLPLVLHGTSGVPDKMVQTLAREHRFAKFNVGTALRQAFGHGLRHEMEQRPDCFDRLELFAPPQTAVGEAAAHVIDLLGSVGQADPRASATVEIEEEE
jgi:fructose-bisphosphate aldolase class II